MANLHKKTKTNVLKIEISMLKIIKKNCIGSDDYMDGKT